MVLDILANQLIQVLPYDKPLVANPVHDAGDQHDIVLLFFAVLRVENDLYYLLGDTE
jgi:hypothetical protein